MISNLLMFLDIFEGSGFFFTIFSLPFLFVPLMFVVVPIVIIVFIVKAVKKHNKTIQDGTTFKNTISNANDPNSYAYSVSGENTNNQCEYCGSQFHRSIKKCPSCGAKVDE